MTCQAKKPQMDSSYSRDTGFQKISRGSDYSNPCFARRDLWNAAHIETQISDSWIHTAEYLNVSSLDEV